MAEAADALKALFETMEIHANEVTDAFLSRLATFLSAGNGEADREISGDQIPIFATAWSMWMEKEMEKALRDLVREQRLRELSGTTNVFNIDYHQVDA